MTVLQGTNPHLNGHRPVLGGLHAVGLLAVVEGPLPGVLEGLLGADGDGAEVVAELVLADPVVVGQLDDEVAVLGAVADLRVGIRKCYSIVLKITFIAY